MAKIPFDIKYRPEIEAGKYEVVTRLDTPVKIFCYDARGKYPIAGLVRDDESDCASSWRIDGSFDGRNESSFDLFLVSDEPELSEFEDALKDYVNARNPENPMTADDARNNATILLAIARKELQPEIDAEVEKAYKNADRMQYEKGKEDAMKDLPRWKKCGEDTGQTILYKGFCKGQNYLEMDGYRIMLSALEKLPKEETK